MKNKKKKRNRRNKKGFTLVELIAIIIIMAIITLIAVPVVTRTVESARLKAFKDSVLNGFNSVDFYLIDNRILDIPSEGLEVTNLDMKHNSFVSGKIIKKDGKYQADDITDGRYCAYGPQENLIVYKGNCDRSIPGCNFTITDGVEGDNDWYISDVELLFETTKAGGTGISYSIDEEIYDKSVSKDNIGSLVINLSNNGINSYRGYVKNGLDIKNVCDITINVDTTDPTIATSTADAVLTVTMGDNNALAGYSITSSAIPPTTYTAVSGTSQTINYTAPASGKYYVHVKDIAGNTSTKAVNIYAEGTSWAYNYNGTNGSDGSYQTFTAPYDGDYIFELYGASGGASGGNGAYTKGTLTLTKGSVFYLFVGGRPTTKYGGFNGGGKTGDSAGNYSVYGGGGATDLRTTNGNEQYDQKRRIMVAAGGGANSSGGAGGALVGIDAIVEPSLLCLDGVNHSSFNYGCIFNITKGGNQLNGGQGGKASVNSYPEQYDSFNLGTSGGWYQGANNSTGESAWSAGGGGGWMGGGGGANTAEYAMGGGGGSSFISGYDGCQAVNGDMQPIGSVSITGISFSNMVMKSGVENMPNHDGTGTMIGNWGNGFAKISIVQ